MTTDATPRKHPGPHHYAPCGEYRPTAANQACTDCQPTCPTCGAHYNRRPTPNTDRSDVAHAVVGELRDTIAKAKETQ